MQACLDQLLRRLGLRPLLEVGRRADHRHAKVRADAHRDHVLRHLLAARTPASKRSDTMSIRP